MKVPFQKYYELVKEIYSNLKAHKLRTLLTSFGIAWGIFILIVLLGISGGVQEGVYRLFKGFTQKTIMFYGGESDENISMRDSGKDITFKFFDLEVIKKSIPNIIAISPEIQNSGTVVIHNSERGHFTIKGINTQSFKLKNLKVKQGRRINKRDIHEGRNICIIGDRIVKQFFSNSNPINKNISVNGTDFLVVGIMDNKSLMSMNEQNCIFIPYTSFSEVIKPIHEFKSFGITVADGNTKWYAEKITSLLAKKYHFDSNNNKALYVVNYEEQMSSFSKLFNGLNIFFVFVGCCLLLSGMIGVSNVMYIIVKERTREIGIKKAVGASSVVVLKEFLFESVILTILSGILGLVIGTGFLKLINLMVSKSTGDDRFFTHTALEPKYIVLAITILLFSGLVAGFLPAFKAAKIKPVVAMRSL